MKKRQKPYLLATLLVVFVAAAVGMNMAANPSKDPQPQQPPASNPNENPLGASRPSGDMKGSATDAANQMKVAGTDAPPTPGTPMPAKKFPGPPAGSLLKPTPAQTKPVPNDSMTSGQWYNSEHGTAPSSK